VRYPASEPALPPGLTGQHFRALTGVRSVSLETLLLKRRLKGPGWLSLDVAEWRQGSGMVGAEHVFLLHVQHVGYNTWCRTWFVHMCHAGSSVSAVFVQKLLQG
jgi:hypothetical protein